MTKLITFKVGEKVTHNGEPGIVMHIPRERELRDCVVVQFKGHGDGLTLLKSSLKKTEGQA